MTWGRIIASALLSGAMLAGIYYHRHPIRIGPPPEPERAALGFAPPPGGEAVAGLLLAPAPGEARRWADFSADAAWGNLLRQEVGGFVALDPAAVAAADLDGFALLVLPERVRPATGEALHDTLEAWVRRGGILVVDNGTLGRYGAPSHAHRSVGRARTFAPGLLDSLTAAGIAATPLALPEGAPAPSDAGGDSGAITWLVGGGPEGGAATPSAGAQPGRLLGVERRGAGGIVTLGFGFARHLLIWQQGLPDPDLGMPVRWRREAGVSLRQTNEFVAEKAFLTTEFPHADAFERLLMAAVETIHPIPRIWYFPPEFDGAFCMSHDDEDFGDRSRALTEEERRQGYGSTMFIIPRRITAAGVAGMHADGAEIALHWWRGWSSSMEEPLGLFGWTPLRRTRPLGEQKRILEERSPGLSVTANRVHGLIWEPHYTRDFRRLEAAGFTLESSYGPAGPAQIGYLFGTGFPFHPIDANGLAFRLEEMPFLYQDDENWDPGIDDRLLGRSRASWHEVVTPLYHTTTMYWAPSVAVMEGFLAAAPRARAANHWVVPMQAYHAFWKGRAALAIRRNAGSGSFAVGAPGPSLPPLALLVPAGWRLVRDAGRMGGEEAAADTTGALPVLRRLDLMGRPYDLVRHSDLGGAFRFQRLPEAGR